MSTVNRRVETRNSWPLRVLSWITAVVVAFVVSQLGHSQHQRSLDFYDHYFAALLERQGTSYTDLAALQQLAASHLGAGFHAVDVVGTPVLLVFLFLPLTYFSLTIAHSIWVGIAIVALAGGTWKAAGNDKWPYWVALVAFSPCTLVAFRLGNPAIITYGLVAFAFGSFRSHQSTRGGVALGFAIAFKLYPAFALIPLLYKREWRALKSTIVTVILLFALTVPVIGLSHVAPAIHQMQRYAGQIDTYEANAGVPALIKYFFGSTVLAKSLGALILLGGAGLLWFRRQSATHVLVALAMLIALLGQQYSWQMYFSVAVLGCFAVRDLSPGRVRKTLAFVFTVLAMGWVNWFITTRVAASHFQSVTQAFGVAGLIALIATAHSAGRTNPKPSLG